MSNSMNEMKAARIRAGYTQSGMAKAVGVSTDTYNRYENGKTDIPLSIVLKFCIAAGIKDPSDRALIFLR